MSAIDIAGVRWPVTGYWCDLCGLPMHAVNVPFGTHPTCDDLNVKDN